MRRPTKLIGMLKMLAAVLFLTIASQAASQDLHQLSAPSWRKMSFQIRTDAALSGDG
jgi:hypothetical protein